MELDRYKIEMDRLRAAIEQTADTGERQRIE